jgi:octaprenyl-diphosphate synthase
MSQRLNEIRSPIARELTAFERHFRASMQSKVSLLDRITYYIVQRKGKQMRPMFVLLSAKLCGGIQEDTYTAASLIELLHTASLIHDDVVDDAYERRGFFSINALWKNKASVLVGDYLLSRGLQITLERQRYDMLQTISEAMQTIAEGELLQLEKARRLDIDESVYYEVIRQKTASLIAAACKTGAASATEDLSVRQRLHDFGEKIGMAFQIRDDLFDFGTADVGKPLGIDIKEKKMTLPLIRALAEADRSVRKNIIRLIRRHSEEPAAIQEVIEFVRHSGGLDYARRVMIDYRDQAFALLDHFADSPAKTSLIDLVNYVVERER